LRTGGDCPIRDEKKRPKGDFQKGHSKKGQNPDTCKKALYKEGPKGGSKKSKRLQGGEGKSKGICLRRRGGRLTAGGPDLTSKEKKEERKTISELSTGEGKGIGLNAQPV